MKRLIVTAAGTVALVAAGTVHSECMNGKTHAATDAETPLMASAEETDAQLLARLKVEEEARKLEKLLETPNTYN